jgi:hypothetical protein
MWSKVEKVLLDATTDCRRHESEFREKKKGFICGPMTERSNNQETSRISLSCGTTMRMPSPGEHEMQLLRDVPMISFIGLLECLSIPPNFTNSTQKQQLTRINACYITPTYTPTQRSPTPTACFHSLHTHQSRSRRPSHHKEQPKKKKAVGATTPE